MSVTAQSATTAFTLFAELPLDLQRHIASLSSPTAACALAECGSVGRVAAEGAASREITVSAATENAAVLQWALETCDEDSAAALRSLAICDIAKRGDSALVRAACKLGCTFEGVSACVAAAEHNHMDTLSTLRNLGAEWNADVCAIAAACGHLEILQYARGRGCEWDQRVANYAALYGFTQVVEWAVANEAEADEDTCSWAAEGGHVATLAALHAAGVEWDDDVCTEAAAAGHIHVLEWAREHDAPLDWESAALAALGNNRDEVIDYLRRQPDYDARECPDLEDHAAERGDVGDVREGEAIEEDEAGPEAIARVRAMVAAREAAREATKGC